MPFSLLKVVVWLAINTVLDHQRIVGNFQNILLSQTSSDHQHMVFEKYLSPLERQYVLDKV